MHLAARLKIRGDAMVGSAVFAAAKWFGITHVADAMSDGRWNYKFSEEAA